MNIKFITEEGLLKAKNNFKSIYKEVLAKPQKSIQELFDFEHVQSRENLTSYIISTINDFDIKKLELVYKFIYNLNLYK